MKQLVKHTGQVLAVAALGTLGTAHAYEWQINENTTFSIGGSVELAYTVTDHGAGTARELTDNGSGLTFAAEHGFSDNLSAYFAAEFDYTVDEAAGSAFSTDTAVFGIKSSIGRVQVGDWDGIYDEHIDDLLDLLEVAGPTGTGSFRTGTGNAIAYFSPSFQGLSFAVQGTFQGQGEGIDHNGNGKPDSEQSFQAVVGYEFNRFAVHLGYDGTGFDEGAGAVIGVGGSIELARLTLSAKVESVGEDSSPKNLLDKEGLLLYGVAAVFDYGPGEITGVINQVQPGADSLDSRTEFGLNINYEIADNFYVYAEHFRTGRDQGKGNLSAVGMVYEF